MKKINKIIS